MSQAVVSKGAGTRFEAQRQMYARDGVCVAERLVGPEVVERARQGIEAVRRGEYDTGMAPEESPWKPGSDPNTLCKIEMAHVASQGIWDMVTHPAFGEYAAAVVGAEMVQLWWLQLLVKPPGKQTKNTNVGWHQDYHYWQCYEPGSELFTLWVSVSDVPAESGPVLFLRGSHKWGLMPVSDFFDQDLAGQKQGIRLPEGAVWDEFAAVMPAGSASIHHSLTYHGSGPNVWTQPRMSFAMHCRSEKSKVVSDPTKVPLELGRNLVMHLNNPRWTPVIYGRDWRQH